MNYMSKKIMSVNNVSVSEWDIMKGIGTLGLPFIHVIETFLLCNQISDDNMMFCNGVIALTVFGPSIFMISMGMKLQKNDNSKMLIRNGRNMLFIAIILNVLRSVIPSIIVYYVAGSSIDRIVSFLFLSDIYLFVGFFYLLLGLFRKVKIPLIGIIIASILMLTLNCLLGGLFITRIETVNAIIGNIIYVDDGSFFPLLSWTIYPVLGMLIEKICENKTQKEIDKICIHTLWISVVILIVAVTALYYTGNNPVQIAVSQLNENITGPLNIVLVLCINMIVIILLRFFNRIIPAKKIKQYLGWLSTNLMCFYLVQWCIVTLICYGIAAILEIYEKTAGISLMMVVSFIVEVLTIMIVRKFGFTIIKFIFKVVRI